MLAVLALWPAAANADIGQEIEHCALETEAAARLACYDALAARHGLAAGGEAAGQAAAALDREFTFSSGRLRSGPLRFEVPVKGAYSPANRSEPYPLPEVENVAGKIRRAMQDIEAWRLRIVVRPLGITVARATAYTGAELEAQAEKALARAGLEASQFDVTIGEPLTGPQASADMRREIQALVEIDIVGLPGN